MGRDIFRVLALFMCCLGAVTPDIEHLTSFWGTDWSYGLHSEVIMYIFGSVSIASFIGFMSIGILRKK